MKETFFQEQMWNLIGTETILLKYTDMYEELGEQFFC